MSAQYTPEPWEVHNGTDIFSRLAAKNGNGDFAPANDGWHIADCDVGLPFDDCSYTTAERRANARRIVACVNACAGIPTPDLEVDNSRLLEMLKERIALKQQRDEMAHQVALANGAVILARQQRDELLAALIEAVCALEVCGKDFRATEIARQAIAKARWQQ